jgi:Fe-S cluster biogenesis protein NfuA
VTTRQSSTSARDTTGAADRAIAREVAAVLAELRPALQSDGGDIELVDVGADGVVQVRLLGACIGCPSSTDTLKLGVEDTLRDRLPQIKEVVCV